MIEAEMRKKIRKSIDISIQEDVLTSNVFGLMGLIENHLLTVLSNAKHIANDNNLAGVVKGKSIKCGSLELWKQFDNKNTKTDKKIDEPDVYFELDDETAIIVEVKFWSGESYENQLTDYAKHCKHLIYLTQAVHQKEAKKNKAYKGCEIYLLDWKEFRETLKTIKVDNGSVEFKIIQKLKTYLHHKIDSYWDGWTINVSNITYEPCKFYMREKGIK